MWVMEVIAMETQVHSMNQLFDQLGLPSGTKDMQYFIAAHRPLAPQVRLSDAPFWSASQAIFLREQIINDADWSDVVDELNVSLR